ncbi:MAG: hypothetical protein NZ651_06680 [Candidatus Bipolaricaulota bacterium]|nr:hypothetical protein [Candidatus Bipolaricaulota bacterium]MDW8127439.1 hypothetical protein [Candidatus Bipolaricaulota bacterium]
MAPARFDAGQVTTAPTAAREGVIWNYSLGLEIRFQYHPEDITETKTLAWNRYPILGVGQPLLSYSGGDVRGLRFRVLFDAHSSPHANGHVEAELRAIRALSIPYDVGGNPTVSLPGNWTSPLATYRQGAGRPCGVPPVVKIAIGGRILKGVLENLEIQEVLHGTTPQAQAQRLCARAWVSFDFLVIEDSRMLVHWAKFQP